MILSPPVKRRIQIFLIALFVLAGLRLWMVIRQRQQAHAPPQPQGEVPMEADYYVVPRKLRAHDLRSAKALTRQPVWVREGYRYTYYPFNTATRRSNFGEEAGTLGPIEKLQITDVVLDASPGNRDQRQVMAVFEKGGNSYAFPIGAVRGGDYQIYIDEMLYIQDPRELYSHWPADIWQAIERQEAREGMNELQVAFAIGMGVPRGSNESAVKTVVYPRGGKELTVTYRDGKAASITDSGPPG